MTPGQVTVRGERGFHAPCTDSQASSRAATVPRMAGKGWTTQVAAAAGIAAGTGAAQLGLGYGLGVVVWPVMPAADDSVWLGSLGWATWIAASSTVFGAVIAERLRGGPAGRPGGPFRFALAAAAAVGALLTVALIALPARAAVRQDTFAPEMIAGGYAVIGILIGLLIAYWAVVSRAVAANLIATAAYLWALAVAGIVVELTMGRDSATYLTSWQFAELGLQARYGTIYWPSALLTLLAAFVLGAVAVWPAVRRGDFGIGAASSGAVGPLLVAAAFFVLAPQLTGPLGQLESAYLIAPYAVLAGLAGSAAMVAAGQRAARRRQAMRHRPAPPTATGTAPVPGRPASATGPSALEADTDEIGAVAVGRPARGLLRRKAAAPRPESPGDKAAAPKAAPEKAAPEKAAPQQAAPQQAAQKVAQKVAPQKMAPQKVAGKPAKPRENAGNGPRKADPPAGTTPEKSTVAAPPPTPTVAKINPPQEAKPDSAG
jgi:hypothetical protein